MHKAHILIVEDNGILAASLKAMVTRMGYAVAGPLASGEQAVAFVAGNRVMGQIMLERLGYEVTARSSSLEALTSFQNDPHRFDVVITDQTMPGMTGIDLARRMLQIRPDIPIILCTGYSSLISEELSRSVGIRGFAMKPVTGKELGVLIKKVLRPS